MTNCTHLAALPLGATLGLAAQASAASVTIRLLPGAATPQPPDALARLSAASASGELPRAFGAIQPTGA